MPETPPTTAPHDSERWTEIEHLPEWDEKFYDVYTARKLGKWVMLKTLKKEYKDDPRFRSMIEKEFDVRYNLAHPAIVMINDFEDVPGLGRCIITDDVYGKSLRRLIDEGSLTDLHVERIVTQMVEAMDYIQRNHIVHFPLRAETVIFTEETGNLKLIDVGYDQCEHLSPTEAQDDIAAFGRVLSEALDNIKSPSAFYRRVADRAAKGGYKSVHELRMALAHRSNMLLIVSIVAFIALMAVLLLWLSSALAPSAPIQ